MTWWSPWRETASAVILEVDLRPRPAWDGPARDWLDAAERERADRFRRGRRQFTRCRSALRANLCERLGCANQDLRFGEGEHGKPFAVVRGRRRDDVAFNVSHSGTWGLIAFASSGRRLGVDLEMRKPRENLVGIGARVYGARELAALRDAQGDARVQAFYRLWTLKEALIKAVGAGFSLNPAGFEVPAPMIHGASSGACLVAGVRWRLDSLEESRFAAAVATGPAP